MRDQISNKFSGAATSPSVTLWGVVLRSNGVSLVIAAAVLLLSGAMMVSCSRSNSFKRRQEYYSDYPKSYYSRPGAPQSPTKRIEVMGQPRKRVLIFDFRNDTPLDLPELERFASDELKRGLFVSERVLIPLKMNEELKTSAYAQGADIRVAQLLREGQKRGVAVIVIGRIVRLIFRQRGDEVGIFRQRQTLAAVDIEAKIFDVSAGREIMAIGRSGETSSNAVVAIDKEDLQSRKFRVEMGQLALRDAMARMVPDILRAIDKMEWKGKIARITGNRVYLNAGRNSGLVAGDILKVLQKSDDVYDPSTGALLGRTPGALKGTVEVLDFLGEDGAISKVHTGGNFIEGDEIKLY